MTAGRQTAAGSGQKGWDAAGYAAGRRLCLEHAPDLAFASNFLSRQRRQGVYAMHALWRQLQQILEPPEESPAGAAADPGQSKTCSGDGSGGCEYCPSRLMGGKSPAADKKEGEDCSSHSLAGRQKVCLSVLDYLYEGERTDKPELDAFLASARRCALDKQLWISVVEGLVRLQQTQRYRTWSLLHADLQLCARPMAVMAQALLRDGDPLWDQMLTVDQATAWATAILLLEQLGQLRKQWGQGRLIVPLDDLQAAGFTEVDFAACVQADAGGGVDPRWQNLQQLLAQRIGNLLRGGERRLSEAAPTASLRGAAVLLAVHRGRLERLSSPSFHLLTQDLRSGLWGRLRRVPQALGFLARPERQPLAQSTEAPQRKAPKAGRGSRQQ